MPILQSPIGGVFFVMSAVVVVFSIVGEFKKFKKKIVQVG